MKLIMDNKVKIINSLMTDVFILQHAHEKRIISDRQYQNLKDFPILEKTIISLIDQVIAKGQETSHEFLQVLKEPEVLRTYPQLKDILKNVP